MVEKSVAAISMEQASSRFQTWSDIAPRFRDTDAMGHVNNAVYVTYLEVARQEYWARFTSAADYAHVPFVVAHLELSLRSPVKVGDIVRVFLRTSYVSNRSFAMEYALYEAGTGRLVAEATTVLVTFDWERECSMPVPDWVRAGLEQIEGGPLPSAAAN